VLPAFERVHNDTFNSKVDDFNQEIKNYCSSTEDIKFINNKLISSLDPSLYSDGVHFSDAGKRHLVRIIKFHLNPFIGLKPYNNYSPPAKESLHNSETIKIIIQVREIDRETREANNITDETM
jgi:hypothetical protein